MPGAGRAREPPLSGLSSCQELARITCASAWGRGRVCWDWGPWWPLVTRTPVTPPPPPPLVRAPAPPSVTARSWWPGENQTRKTRRKLLTKGACHWSWTPFLNIHDVFLFNRTEDFSNNRMPRRTLSLSPGWRLGESFDRNLYSDIHADRDDEVELFLEKYVLPLQDSCSEYDSGIEGFLLMIFHLFWIISKFQDITHLTHGLRTLVRKCQVKKKRFKSIK